jgi:hypothetical protein
MMSCMLKAAVPRPTATRSAGAPACDEGAPGFGAEGRGAGLALARAAAPVAGLLLPQRARLSTRVHGRALHHLDQRTWLKSASSAPKASALPTMPSSSITYISATTRGRVLRRQVGGQRQAGGLRGLHAGADQQEGQRRADWPSQAGPLGVARQQEQRERHDRQAAELQQRAHPDVGHALPAQRRACVSERKPISARNGANTSGSATISATSQAGTPSSTIITRFSVPTSSAVAMPTDTWNSDRRSSRPAAARRVAARRQTAGTRAHARAQPAHRRSGCMRRGFMSLRTSSKACEV